MNGRQRHFGRIVAAQTREIGMDALFVDNLQAIDDADAQIGTADIDADQHRLLDPQLNIDALLDRIHVPGQFQGNGLHDFLEAGFGLRNAEMRPGIQQAWHAAGQF